MLTWNGNKINSVVIGSIPPTDETATAEDIKLGKTASINGEKVIGTLVPLGKEDVIKQLIDLRRTAEYLFTGHEWNDASKITDEFLEECLKFDTTENARYCRYMFARCDKITKVPSFSTKGLIGTDMPIRNMFTACYALREAPMLDLSAVADTTELFFDCQKLMTVPLYDLRNVKSVYSIINRCVSLKVVPAWDLRNGITYTYFMNECRAVEEIWIKNIKASLSVGGGAGVNIWGHLIKKECLVHLIRELRDTGASKTLTMGATNLAKIAETYVRTIDITDEMRAEDDLIDEKLPFEICNSTDEGAMLITEYTQLKNWQLA